LNNSNVIIIEGELLKFSYGTKILALRSPELYTGTLFRESLRRAGISIGRTLMDGVVPRTAPEIARHIQPLGKTITQMNKISDNLAAENILKIIGAERTGGLGTARQGLTVSKQFLAAAGIDTTRCSFADGSGVSRYNLFSADQIVQLLIAMYKQPKLFPIFYNSLPLAGMDGTLSGRMAVYPAANNLRAKTGTLNGVSCLSGYVHTRDGEMLAFSILMQNFITPTSDYRRAQDKIGALLAGLSRSSHIQRN
jgi:D-alanyl-D-alanine carboxypeptidase/D-alanyl-D-alanine-endopeptidase (penicillin-binding protein 4)